jgi:predicted RNase H-like HicB family nuclease
VQSGQAEAVRAVFFGSVLAYSTRVEPSRQFWPFWSETSRPEPRAQTLFERVRIRSLDHRRLVHPIDVVVEPDGDGFIAKTPELTEVFGFGDAASEAVDSLKREIESLYEDLMQDDNFTPAWLRVKTFLKNLVLESNR